MECSCGAEVIEGKLKSGTVQIFDAKPSPDGQYVVVDGIAASLQGGSLRVAARIGLRLYTRHAVKCPHYWRNR